MEVAVNYMQEGEFKIICKALENSFSSCYSHWYLLCSLVVTDFLKSVGTCSTSPKTVLIGKYYCSYSNASTVTLAVMSKLTPDHIIRTWKVSLSGLQSRK